MTKFDDLPTLQWKHPNGLRSGRVKVVRSNVELGYYIYNESGMLMTCVHADKLDDLLEPIPIQTPILTPEEAKELDV